MPGVPNELFVQLDELYDLGEEEVEWREAARWMRYEENLEPGAERWGRPHVSSLSFQSLLTLRSLIEKCSIVLDLEQASSDDDFFAQITDTILKKMLQDSQILPDDEEILDWLLQSRHHPVVESSFEITLKNQPHLNSLGKFYYRQFNSQEVMSLELAEGHTTNKRHRLQRQATVGSREQLKRGASFQEHARSREKRSSSWGDPLPTIREGWSEGNESSAKFTPEGGKRKYPVGVARSVPICFSEPLPPIEEEPTAEHKSSVVLKLSPLTKDPDEPVKGKKKKKHALVTRLPSDTECALLLVGSVSFLKQPTVGLVRLEMATPIQKITEILLPVKFIFILLGPINAGIDYHEIGRCMGTLFSTNKFRCVAYKAGENGDLVEGINEFLGRSIVLPPGKWDAERLMPYKELKLKAQWLQGQNSSKSTTVSKSSTDTLSLHCILSVIFLFLPCFYPALTFGAILSTKSKNRIGIKETLMATSFGGIIFSLFSTQPLLLVGVNGPMLIFETSLAKACKQAGVDYMETRVWTAMWAFLFCAVTVALEGPFLIRYLTKFADDILNVLISVIFFYEIYQFIVTIFDKHPLEELEKYCSSIINITLNDSLCSSPSYEHEDESNSLDFLTLDKQGRAEPNTALVSCFILLGTFGIGYTLFQFQSSKLLVRKVRRLIGASSLSVAAILVTLFDKFALETNTKSYQLNVADAFNRTRWIVEPEVKQWWLPLAGFIGGFLFFLILFVESEAAQLCLAERKPQLKKGTGFHWDFLLTGFINLVFSFLGLPWICANILQSVHHFESLVQFKQRAPGQPPKAVAVLDQRVTAFVLSILVGVSLILLQHSNGIPVAVLFGVFLYLGVVNLYGNTMVERTLLFFVPLKYHPAEPYCLRVKTGRMHIFTIIQLLCLAVALTIKCANPIGAVFFPLAVVLAVCVRHLGLTKIFTRTELIMLDGEEPDENDEHENEVSEVSGCPESSPVFRPRRRGASTRRL